MGSFKPQAGGGASTSLGGALKSPSEAILKQPENPGDTSKQELKRHEKREEVVPIPVARVTETPQKDGSVVKITETFAPQIVKTEVKEEGKTELGAAQKDTSREIAAKLASYSKLQYIGVGLILFGAASLFYAPLRILMGGGKQLGIAIAALGGLLIVAPMLIVGNEGLILIGAIVVGVLAWGAIRLTRKEAEADLLARK